MFYPTVEEDRFRHVQKMESSLSLLLFAVSVSLSKCSAEKEIEREKGKTLHAQNKEGKPKSVSDY